MKKNIVASLVVSSCLLLSAPLLAQNIAVVNGKTVANTELNKIELELKNQGQVVTPEIRDRIKQELIAKEVFLQEANKQAVAKQADYIAAVETIKQNLLLEGLFTNYLKKNPISAAEIKADYDKTVAALGTQEYKVSHILVETEVAAKAVASDIKKTNFAAVAKKKSIDKSSAENGGDLGWIVPANYVPEFGGAFVKLKKGQLSAPVQTPFGWHIIKLEEQRKLDIPPLAEVKPQIEQRLQDLKLAEYQRALVSTAKIEVK